jgi:hypothetical protein
MFIKHGDGKIVNVFGDEELTEEQKKSVKKAVKESNTQTDTSQQKKSGS